MSDLSPAVKHFMIHGKGVCAICLAKVDKDEGKLIDGRLVCKRHDLIDLTKQPEKE